MIELARTVEVAVAAEDAFAFLAQPERFPEWQPGIRSVVRTSPGPLGIGSTYAIVLEGPGGMTVHAEGRVVAYRPPERVEIEGNSSMLRLDGAYEVEPLATDRCRVHMRTRLQPLGLLRFMQGRIREELERELPQAMLRLASAIEAASAA